MYKKIWSVSKVRIVCIFLLSILDVINMLATTFFFKVIIDGISAGKTTNYFLIIVMIRLGILLIYQCCDNIFTNYIYKKIDLKINKVLSLELYEKIKKIDLVIIDNTEFYDKYQRAINEIDSRPKQLLDTLRFMLSSIFQVISLLITISYFSPLLISISVIGMLVTVWGNVINTKKSYEMNLLTTKIHRRYDYIKRIFYLPQYKEDIKETDLYNLLKEKYVEINHDEKTVIKKFWPSIIAIAVSASWLYNFVNVGIVSLVLIYQITKRTLSIGDFTSVGFATNNLSNALLQFSDIIPQYTSHSLYISNYLEVINYKPQKKENDINKILHKNEIKNLTLQNVSFHYPEQNCLALNNISLHIDDGEKIAIVGENGAGKTTLVKIILKIYNIDAGKIYINDINYEDIECNSIYKAIGICEQHYNHYSVSIRENVALSQYDGEIDDTKVWNTISKVGLEKVVQELPHNIHTIITKEFDQEGIEFSGGQYQRLALARVLYQDPKIIILDEPSSALDPITEEQIFKLIYELANNKILILISHRLSGVKDMDRIIVMDHGAIIEEGNHDELIELNGKYANMFRIQSERYAE